MRVHDARKAMVFGGLVLAGAVGVVEWQRPRVADGSGDRDGWVAPALGAIGVGAALAGAAMLAAGPLRDRGVRSLADLVIEGRPFQQVLDQDVLRFAVTGTGPIETRSFAPANDAARAALALPSGPRTQAMIDGILRSVPATQSARTELDDLLLATTRAGDVAASAALTSSGAPLSRSRLVGIARDIRRGTLRSTGADVRSVYMIGESALLLPSRSTRALTDAASAPRGSLSPAARRAALDTARSVAHELGHAVSPRRADGRRWLEEGAADLIAEARFEETARRMGIAVDPKDADLLRHHSGYSDFVTSVRVLAARAGFDLRGNRDDFLAFEELFQSQDETSFLEQIAGLVAARHGMSHEVEAITQDLLAWNGKPRPLAWLLHRYDIDTSGLPDRFPTAAPAA